MASSNGVTESTQEKLYYLATVPSSALTATDINGAGGAESTSLVGNLIDIGDVEVSTTVITSSYMGEDFEKYTTGQSALSQVTFQVEVDLNDTIHKAIRDHSTKTPSQFLIEYNSDNGVAGDTITYEVITGFVINPVMGVPSGGIATLSFTVQPTVKPTWIDVD